MSMQKYLFSVALMVVAVIAVAAVEPENGIYADNKSHDMIIGSRLPGDRLYVKDNIVTNSSIEAIEKIYYIISDERITLIEALDQETNGNGAYPRLLNGGPGSTDVTLKFESQKGHGINFIVNIYTRP